MLKEAHPELIEVVGGQVMNTHTSFHRRMLHAEEAHAAYNIALRTSTGYEASLARREPVHAHPHPLLHRVTGLCCARTAECRRRPAAQSNPLRARRDLGLWRAGGAPLEECVPIGVRGVYKRGRTPGGAGIGYSPEQT